MSVPAELLYTQEHEWVAIDGGTATIGITDYATQHSATSCTCRCLRSGRP